MKMKQIIKLLLIFVICYSTTILAYSPEGFWAAKDDHSGKILSIIQMWQAKDGRYNGRIYKIMDVTVNGKRQDPKDTCTTCSGTLLNKPMLCLQVVYNMKPAANSPDTWEDGKAYDPKSDNTYHAKMWLKDDGNVLNLRGYVLMPLLGRTQEWTRVNKPDMSSWVCNRSIADTYHLI